MPPLWGSAFLAACSTDMPRLRRSAEDIPRQPSHTWLRNGVAKGGSSRTAFPRESPVSVSFRGDSCGGVSLHAGRRRLETGDFYLKDEGIGSAGLACGSA